jgi:hypothetical protein
MFNVGTHESFECPFIQIQVHPNLVTRVFRPDFSLYQTKTGPKRLVVGGGNLNFVFTKCFKNLGGNLLVLKSEFYRDSVKRTVLSAVRGIFTGAGG